MQSTQPVETAQSFEFTSAVKRCQTCKAFFKLEDLNLDTRTGKGTCDRCIKA